MISYNIILENLLTGVSKRDIYLQDYIRVKRKKNYDSLLFKQYGIMVFSIQDFKYDHEILRFSEKDEYEIILVKDLIMEIVNILKYIKTS